MITVAVSVLIRVTFYHSNLILTSKNSFQQRTLVQRLVNTTLLISRRHRQTSGFSIHSFIDIFAFNEEYRFKAAMERAQKWQMTWDEHGKSISKA